MKKIIKEITPIKKKAENVPTKKRVAAYARVSTEQDEQLHSLQVQRDYYENYIKQGRQYLKGVFQIHSSQDMGL